MSIWASLQGITGWDCPGVGTDDTGPVRRMKIAGRDFDPDEVEPCHGCEECEVGSPHRYGHSNVMPEPTGERDGAVHLAVLNAGVRHDRHCRECRDNYGSCGQPWWDRFEPFLRLSVAENYDIGGTVVLNEAQVRKLRDTLDEWLDQELTIWEPDTSADQTWVHCPECDGKCFTGGGLCGRCGGFGQVPVAHEEEQ